MQTIEQLKSAIQAAEAAYAADRAKIAKLKNVDRVMNEGGEGYSRYEAESERLFNHHTPIIIAAKEALFAAEWTAEVFAKRRAAWNASVVKCKSYKDMAALAARLGFGHSDLAKAKRLLGIQ